MPWQYGFRKNVAYINRWKEEAAVLLNIHVVCCSDGLLGGVEGLSDVKVLADKGQEDVTNGKADVDFTCGRADVECSSDAMHGLKNVAHDGKENLSEASPLSGLSVTSKGAKSTTVKINVCASET
ncbi:hypothetical protein PoB_001647900 [Plakobranchus ocellatus]|uniref:Uncharacterized protein n=1 Tax=Plakobranchus ocellatus TaxID=259542 RepID=A0AAV3Z6H8_9GAST|nr:hypothetical protein PoB_001647900 [Plakobranchus ocellatus]